MTRLPRLPYDFTVPEPNVADADDVLPIVGTFDLRLRPPGCKRQGRDQLRLPAEQQPLLWNWVAGTSKADNLLPVNRCAGFREDKTIEQSFACLPCFLFG